MSLISSLESKSEYPIAKSITKFLEEKNINAQIVTNFKMKVARGVEGEILEKRYFCGNEKYFRENNIEIDEKIKEKLKNIQKMQKI